MDCKEMGLRWSVEIATTDKKDVLVKVTAESPMGRKQIQAVSQKLVETRANYLFVNKVINNDAAPTENIIIYDIDDTLSLTQHRAHILDTDDPDKWDKFYLACGDDAPNQPLIDGLNEALSDGISNDRILFFTGRSEVCRELTVKWLAKHINIPECDINENLYMRDIGDYTPAGKLKSKLYTNLPADDKRRVAVIVDDDKRVIDAFQEMGVATYHCDSSVSTEQI